MTRRTRSSCKNTKKNHAPSLRVLPQLAAFRLGQEEDAATVGLNEALPKLQQNMKISSILSQELEARNRKEKLRSKPG